MKRVYSAEVMDLANKCKNPIVRSAILSGMVGGDNSARMANRRLNREWRNYDAAREREDAIVQSMVEEMIARPELEKDEDFRNRGFKQAMKASQCRDTQDAMRDARRALCRFREGEGV